MVTVRNKLTGKVTSYSSGSKASSKPSSKSSTPSGLSFDSISQSQSGLDREQIATQAQAPVSRYTSPKVTTPIEDIVLAPGQTPTRYTAPPTIARPTGPAAVDEKAIREETRKRMQSSIDAINANYANLIAQDKIEGQDRSGQTRAINARSGLIGSDFGTAQQEKTTQYNKQQQQFLVDQQNAQIASVMQNIEDRASAEIQLRKQEALGQYERDLSAYKDAQEQARADFQLLAQSGMDLNALNPAQKAALIKQSGYDEQFGELIYNAMKPKPKQIDYKFEKLADGRGMFYGVDPQTGELKRIDVSVDLPPDWQMQIAPDGTIIGYDKNTGQAKVLSEQGQFADPYDRAFKQAQIEKIYAELANGGEDKPLTLEEAKELGVPIGTTRSQVAGIVPGQEENFKLTQRALDEAKTTQSLIEELINHPGRKDATGAMRWLTALPGNARDFTAKFDQLIAQLQLQNISKLRGTGPITEREQEVLKKAATSLRRDIGEGAFLNELQRLYQSTGSIANELEEQRTKYQSNSLFNEFESGGSEGKDFFKVKGSEQTTEQRKSNTTPYLKTLGPITGIDGSKYWKWGLDVDLKKGDKVKAPVNGQIVALKTSNQTGGFGNQIRIKSDDGKEIWLSHLDKLPAAKPGTRIKAGQVLALGGNSGNTYSTSGGDGSHLDITMPKPGGGYYTAREVKAYLDKSFV